MRRVGGAKDYISLAKGLVTEASPLAFPENATSDELNFLLDKDGMVRVRRKGLERKVVFPVSEPTGITLQTAHYWQSPDVIMFIIGRGVFGSTTAYFHRNDEDLTLIGEIEIASNVTDVTIAEQTTVIFLTTSDGTKPLCLEYEKENSKIVLYEVSIQVRDFELVDDGLDLTERPSSLNIDHRYNLYNAGWYADRRDNKLSRDPSRPALIIFLEDDQGGAPSDDFTYPSNADQVSLGLFTNENGVTVLSADEVKNATVGNTEAPRGHYIFDINDFDRTPRAADRFLEGSLRSTVSEIGSINL